MRFLKLAVISIIFFFLLLTAMSLLLPSTTNISRAIDINATPAKVFGYVRDIKKWKYWYANYDSLNASFPPASAAKGNSFTINGTTVTIQQTLPAKIKASWQTGDNETIFGEFNFISNNSDSSTTLQWNLVQKVKWYPWQKLASIVSNKTISPFMEQSLQNLKNEAEKQ